MAKKQQQTTNHPIQLGWWGQSSEPTDAPAASATVCLDFKGNAVRTVEINGEPWWVAVDICRVLGIQNVTEAVKGKRDEDGLDDDEWGLDNVDTPSGTQQMLVVSESGLYGLVYKSRKPEAKDFKRWVRKEVLPGIRKHGFYALSQRYNRVENMAKRLKCRPDFKRATRRVESVDVNKELHSDVIARGGGPREIAKLHDARYRGAMGVSCKEVKAKANLKRWQTPLDHMDALSLSIHNHAVDLTAKRMEGFGRELTVDEQALLMESATRELAEADIHRLGPEYEYRVEYRQGGRPLIGIMRRQITAS